MRDITHPTAAARRSRAGRGLTLIELVVAMAIFALVAVMGLQSLTGALRLRDRLAALEAEQAALALALGLMRHDLAAALPLAFYPPGGAAPRSALAELRGPGPGFAVSAGGQPDLPPVAGGGMHRIEWRLDRDTGLLSRRIWPVLTPADAAAQSPAMPVLTGVAGLGLRSYWPGTGWVPGLVNARPDPVAPPGPRDDDAGPGAPPETYSSTLPLAVEVTLVTAAGPVTILESFR